MSQRLKADLALTVCSLIWGASFVIVKQGLAYASVFVFLGVRFAVASALMGLIYWRALRQLNWNALRAGVQLGAVLFFGYALETVGLKSTTASKAAFIVGFSVVLVPLFLAIFWRQHVNRWIWVGALAALAGLYFLTIPPEGFVRINHGDLLVAAASILFALHIILVGRYSPRHSVGALSFLQIATTAALSILFVPLFARAGWEMPRVAWNGSFLFAIGFTAVGSTALGFSLQNWAQRYTSPPHAAILFSLDPVFAAIASYLILGEHMSSRALSGAGLLLAGILLAELKGPTQAAPEFPGPISERIEPEA